MNPPGEIRIERFGWTFCPGDKVMQVENDYDRTRIPAAPPLQTRSQPMTAPEAYHRARIASEKIREAKAQDKWKMRGSAR